MIGLVNLFHRNNKYKKTDRSENKNFNIVQVIPQPSNNYLHAPIVKCTILLNIVR